jgi:hypothetical protein
LLNNGDFQNINESVEKTETPLEKLRVGNRDSVSSLVLERMWMSVAFTVVTPAWSW